MARLLRPQTFRARALRRACTPAERALWQLLRGRRLAGAKFRRQQPLGHFVVDFFCEQARLVIEADGDYHGEASVAERDAHRDAFLRAAGLTVLRISNQEILEHPERTLEHIRRHLRAADLKEDFSPLPPGEGLGGEGTRDATGMPHACPFEA